MRAPAAWYASWSDWDCPNFFERKVGTKPKSPVSTAQRMLSKKTARMGGRRQNRQAWGAPTALLFEPGFSSWGCQTRALCIIIERLVAKRSARYDKSK